MCSRYLLMSLTVISAFTSTLLKNLSMSRSLRAVGRQNDASWHAGLHTSLSSAVLISWLKLSPVKSLVLLIHDFAGLPLFLDPSVPPCGMVLAKLPFHLITWPNHCNFLLLTIVNKCCCLSVYLSISSRTCLFVACAEKWTCNNRHMQFISKAVLHFSISALIIQVSHP